MAPSPDDFRLFNPTGMLVATTVAVAAVALSFPFFNPKVKPGITRREALVAKSVLLLVTGSMLWLLVNVAALWLRLHLR